MSNETQTPASQPDSAEGSNGFDNVASQYRAMQEAQLLHEETINQLREEIRGQREKLAELSKATPTVKGGQVDMLSLRLTELERKVGEGAPDPLLNEIVHRLAALENNGPARGAKDPRVDEVYKQLDDLRQQIEDAGGSDARTDDVVLRIASLEGAFRRAAQSRDAEEVQARIDELAEELSSRQAAELAELRTSFSEAAKAAAKAAEESDGDEASTAALGNLTERLTNVEERLGKAASPEQLATFGEQLAELDRKLSEQTNGEEIEQRLQALEQREAPPAASVDLSEVTGRVEQVERKLEDSDVSQRLLELAGRLRSLENKVEEGGPEPTEAPQLSSRIAELEAGIAGLQQASQQGGGDPSPALVARLDELESRVADAESASRLEDAHARLETLETKWNALGDPSDVGRRLTVLEMDERESDPKLDELVQRLGALEAAPPESAADPRLATLGETVSHLKKELDTVSQDWLPVYSELPDRLTRLEAQVRELSQRPLPQPSEPTEPEAATELREELRSLSLRLEELTAAPPTAAPAQDPRFAELAARVDYVEQAATQPPAPALNLDELVARLERLERAEPAAADEGATGGLSPALREEIASRLGALEEAVKIGSGGASGADFEGLLRKETERWNQWARSTVDEIGEIRGRVESMGGGSSGSGLDTEAVEALGVRITTGLNTSEVKGLRAQMYFVYLSIGVLFALVLYLLVVG